MSEISGMWRFVMTSSFGDQEVTVAMTEFGGLVSGSAITANNSPRIQGGRWEGGALRFTLAMAAPIPAELAFDLTAGGGLAVGHFTVDGLLAGDVSAVRLAR